MCVSHTFGLTVACKDINFENKFSKSTLNIFIYFHLGKILRLIQITSDEEKLPLSMYMSTRTTHRNDSMLFSTLINLEFEFLLCRIHFSISIMCHLYVCLYFEGCYMEMKLELEQNWMINVLIPISELQFLRCI